jgi:hypothetical protein
VACAIGLSFVIRSSADSSSSQIVFSSTFPSGASFRSIAPGPGGTIYVAGTADLAAPSADQFPTTPNAFQRNPPPVSASTNGIPPTVPFFAVIDPTQSGSAQLIYSTYFGGSGASGRKGFLPDSLFGFAVDKAGRAYLCGVTSSVDFPVTANAFRTTLPTNSSGAPADAGFFPWSIPASPAPTNWFIPLTSPGARVLL